MILLRKTPSNPLYKSFKAYFVLLTIILDTCTARRSGRPLNQENNNQNQSLQNSVNNQEVDFLAIDFLLDGERERRLRYRGVSAKETSTGGERSISLRQISDGKHFIQMIHSPKGLLDCDYSRRRKTIDAFLDSFRRDSKRTLTVSHSLNRTSGSANHNQGAGEEGELGEDRIRERKKIEEFIENGVLTPEDLDFNWNQRRVGVHNATFLIVKSYKQIPRDMRSWLDFRKLRRQCQTKHRELRRDLKRRERQREKALKHEAEQISLTTANAAASGRTKRGLSSLLRIPGTEWCGLGYGVSKYTQVGGFSAADRCCRTHDMRCKHWIQGFREKYGYFNWSVNTLMHCNCDQRFRTCLKLAGGTTADLVGKLFFNVVQTKCFVFKTEKVCSKYTWWKNTCKKFTKKKRAVLRPNMAY